MTLTWRRFISRQLRRPSGWFGRRVIARRFQTLNAAINSSTLEALELQSDDRVLEVGFGPGDLMAAALAHLPDGRVAGADFSRDMVQLCQRRFCDEIAAGRARVECSEVTAMPFEDAVFTKACTVNTIYFWPDLAGPLREFHRVLAPGGRLVIAFSPPATMEPLGVARDVFTLWDPSEVQALLAEAGFAESRSVVGAGPSGDFVCVVASKPHS